jgi:Branched-chain amino acid transport protein (AzlD)
MSGWQGFFTLLAIAVLVHEPWRWAGYVLGRRLNPDDEIFKWVKAVSTALVAALAARLLLFPSGALAGIPLWLRIAAFALGLAVFYASGKAAWKGVCAGAALIGVGKLVVG